jgi:hypothetical protein
LIDKFLETRIKSENGGWPEVSHAEINQLYSIIDKLINTKWQKDCDGDPPVRIKLIDRTRYEAFHYQPIPYDFDHENNDFDKLNSEYSFKDILRKKILNLNVATQEIERTLYILEYYGKKEK